MADLYGWDLERYLSHLRVRVRALGLDRALQARFSESDVVAETLARAVASPSPCHGSSHAERLGWLEAIQDHILIDKWREGHASKRDVSREQVFRQHLGDTTGGWERHLAASQLAPSAIASGREVMLRITRAIDTLPQRERDVAISHLLLGLSLQEVADSLGLTRGVVGNLHRNVLKHLRLELEDLKE